MKAFVSRFIGSFRVSVNTMQNIHQNYLNCNYDAATTISSYTNSIWIRHAMETLPVLPLDSPHKGPVIRSLDVSIDDSMNRLLKKLLFGLLGPFVDKCINAGVVFSQVIGLQMRHIHVNRLLLSFTTHHACHWNYPYRVNVFNCCDEHFG